MQSSGGYLVIVIVVYLLFLLMEVIKTHHGYQMYDVYHDENAHFAHQ